MIETFGLHWHIDKVFWGWQRNAGSLLGAVKKGKNSVPVEFREQRGIYALYAEYDLVYIGQTGSGSDRLLKRLRTHRTDHLADRWDRFSWFGIKWVKANNELSADTRANSAEISEILNILEAISISIAEPRLNLQRGRWKGTQQYFQVDARQEDDE